LPVCPLWPRGPLGVGLIEQLIVLIIAWVVYAAALYFYFRLLTMLKQ
jgi:hypothetical protein